MLQWIKIAYRNIGRNRRRSLLSALAVALGLALLLFMAAFIEGEMSGALESSIRLESGHLQVRAATYDEDKVSLTWEDLIENPEQLVEQVGTLKQVKVATPRLRANGILAIRDESAGVLVMGIDPNSEANKPLVEGMVAGEFLSPDDREGLLIGQPLADNLGVHAGDKVNLLVSTSDGGVDEQIFSVRGIFSTRTPSYDKATVFLPLSKAQTFTRTENHASLIFVLLKDREQAEAVSASLQNSRYEVPTWRKLNELLIQTEQMANGFMVLFNLIVLAITATVITNTLVMSVFERTREIGILAAIGLKGRQIMVMFLAEAGLLALGGIALGLILGGLLVAYFTKYGFFIGDVGLTGMIFGDTIYPYLTLNDTVSLTITTLIITLLAALYPAGLAARLEPVEALRGK